MRIVRPLGPRSFAFFFTLVGALPLFAQSAGTIHGTVLDPSGAVVKGATLEIQNPVSRYNKSVKTDAQGNFEFDNVPYNPYHVSVVAPGFETTEQDVDLRSAIPLEVRVTLKIGTSNASVTV